MKHEQNAFAIRPEKECKEWGREKKESQLQSFLGYTLTRQVTCTIASNQAGAKNSYHDFKHKFSVQEFYFKEAFPGVSSTEAAI